ncbi:hypothetical protein AVEN_219265-1 [Araneus ventricosus]|uniref:Uncharacterized protein n=1 Tax=Araneus ventricosus TaxID=182803 RepID=A0A4Y2CEX1_ARAVE|nr:hypothetical protein AVEN_219265-1 [Araneus ventricosus]
MSSDVLDGEAKVRIFSDKLKKLYSIFSNITGKKAVSKKQKDAFNDLKADILMFSVASEDFVVMCLTETWLCEQIDSSDLFDDRYPVFRKDRDSTTSSCKCGASVMVVTKKNISASQIHVPLTDLECI